MSELLLPVGNINMALAAIHNGADAIYVGMPGFNARGRSHDHSFDELEEIIQMCHLYNVHIHVAFNILIFQNEIPKAIESLKKVITLSPDALIVQDIGLIKIIKTIAPDQIVHGSTQMSITNHEAIHLLSDLDIKRFVLGRENTLPEIKSIKDKTDKELEVFVHGALCVAYSGQCFTSEALGGRSANRGQCAQSCRFDYELYVDDKKKELVEQKYLVSPQDLCGINEISELMDIGVESFKVEGRLKGPEYVSSVARSYRSAIDKDNISKQKENYLAMEVSYSRGFYPGWLKGVAHQELVKGSFSSNRGKLIGRVLKNKNSSISLESDFILKAGDGILIADKNLELGGHVYNVKKDNAKYEIKLSRDFDYSKIKPGQEIYLTARDSIYKDLQKSYTQKDQFKKIPIKVEVSGTECNAIELKVQTNETIATIKTSSTLEASKNQTLNKDNIFKALNGLTNTVYTIDEFTFNIGPNLFIHNRALKELKQKMVEKLNSERLARPQVSIRAFELGEIKKNINTKTQLNILLRKVDQIKAVQEIIKHSPDLKVFISKIILDFEFGKDFAQAVQLIKDMGIESTIATTRILKPNEYYNFKQIERAAPDSILIRNLGALNYFQDREFKLYGDFSLNVTNSVTAEYLLNKGLDTVCASYDLNANHLDDLIDSSDASKIEVTVHQYMPEFHMEHCVFAAFLSKGNSFKDCGKPCEKHEVHLKDMYGNTHEIKADQECRNTMFKATPQSSVSLIPEWENKGVSLFRFEALHEAHEQLISKLEVYLNVIAKKMTPAQAFSKMGMLENYGVTTGQLLKSKAYKDKKKRT